MLIVSNGAFKSGSTWVTLILRQLGPFATVPREFSGENWAGDSIRPDAMEKFLRETDLEPNDYLIKAHFKPEDGLRPLLLENPRVKVLNVYRDPKDVVVSAYFHYQRSGDFSGAFGEFLAQRAERLVRQLTRYHLYWDPTGVEEAIFFTTYEKLHRNFADEVFRMGHFLERDLTDENLATIRRQTEFSNLKSRIKKPTAQRFFRKGVMGDWQEHMTPEQGAWIDQIEAEEGICLVQDPIVY